MSGSILKRLKQITKPNLPLTGLLQKFVHLKTKYENIKEVVFVILSQQNKYHAELAKNLLDDILYQSEAIYNGEKPVVHLSHIDFPHVGDWTVFPLIPKLHNLHKKNSSWVFFLEDHTKVRLNMLLHYLSKYDANKEIWIGSALHDENPTIIHHFAFYENTTFFKYPNMASGFAMSSPLLESLSERIKKPSSTTDFSIDSAHELALFIWNKGEGQMLQHEPALCNKEEPHCAAFPSQFRACDIAIPNDSMYFAVKTCEKYHEDRISIVKATWAKDAARLNFFSDVKDELVPTITLGIPNTEQGHCGKTMAILRYIWQETKNDSDIRWIILVDDDTILSVPRLQQLLTCYDHKEAVALGQRYGYKVYSPQGYNYITGGAGMVFSKELLKKLVDESAFECPSLNTPDDMFLGMCIAGIGVSVTHSLFFHQARPVDYAPGYLESQTSVSFHKHWMIDPLKTYKRWLMDGDTNTNAKQSSKHNEL